MAAPVSEKLVRDYFAAQLSRDPTRLAAFLHNDVLWSIMGPVDLLRFCGEHRGKQAVMETICLHGPAILKVSELSFDEILVDGDRAATFSRLSAVHAATGRRVSYRCAQFLRFQDGKLIEFRALIDSFDAAEQMLGRQIEVAAPRETDENVYAV
jgi:ketosteroid isomerase-like protein